MTLTDKQNEDRIYQEELEKEILEGYGRLIEAIILDVLQKVRLKQSLKGSRMNRKVAAQKLVELEEVKEWMKTNKARFWFKAYGLVTGRNPERMVTGLMKACKETEEYLSKVINS